MNASLAPIQLRASAPARFTKAEFIAMCESGVFDDIKIELVRGELERTDLPMSEHSFLQAAVCVKLGTAIEGTTLAGLAGTGLDLADDTLRACDAAVITAVTRERRHARGSEVVLAVEVVVATRAREMGDKRIDYATGGIANYWVVDGSRRVVHVFGEPIDGDYAQVSTTRFDQPLNVPGTERCITID